MDPEQHEELTELRIEAARVVAEGPWLLRLSTHVSEGGVGAVGIMSGSGGGDSAEVVQRFWEIEADRAKLGSRIERRMHPRPLPPTIREHRVPANAAQARAFILQLGSLEIPVLPVRDEAAAGQVVYEVHVASGQQSTTLRWANAAPEGWEKISVWFGAAWSGLSQCVQEGTEEV